MKRATFALALAAFAALAAAPAILNVVRPAVAAERMIR